MRVIIARIEGVTANSSWFVGKRETIQERAFEKLAGDTNPFLLPWQLAQTLFLGTGYSVLYSPNSSRSRLVCARLTGISLCFLSSMRNW
jgi:hypothetical protein